MADLPKWAEEKFKAYKDDVVSCCTCWALVDIAEVKWHDKWHQGENYKDPES